MGERPGNKNSKRELERPIRKIVLSLQRNGLRFPAVEANKWYVEIKSVISRCVKPITDMSRQKVSFQGEPCEAAPWRSEVLTVWRKTCLQL